MSSWIAEWHPEDEKFWAKTGEQVAKRNLIWSVFSEHIGFSVWVLWSVSAALLVKAGFNFSPTQLFTLVAVPNLVGALVRIPYTFAVPKFGGRNWTIISSLLLLIPTLLFAVAVNNPSTPFWVFVLVAATAGLGGGNFASSMANINFFYPAAKKGAALGLNAAGGNFGVALVQFLLPVLVGGAGIFGLVKASSSGIELARVGYIYAALTILAALFAAKFMNNLTSAKSNSAEFKAILADKHTWVMSFLYIGTFGSFIGYSVAMPLLIKLNFWVPTPEPAGTGINFAYYAFIGALVGSITRPFGGWLADKYGGAKVTFWVFVAMILGTLAVLLTLLQLTPNPAKTAAIATENATIFPWFLTAFIFVFAASGIGNGSTYRMIPSIRRAAVDAKHLPGTPTHEAAVLQATKESSAAIGLSGAIGALGGFLIPLGFGAPWVANPVASVKIALVVFASFYALCLALTWFEYLRRSFLMERLPSLAHAEV